MENFTYENQKEEKDFTRPTFLRKPGELGIFIDIYDAVANGKEVFGSRQYFMMALLDKFYQEVSKGELYKIKGFFFKRNLLSNVTIEYFQPGVLLIVNINELEGLHQMISHYETGKLNDAFVECFVNEKLERKLAVKNLKLKIKIFPDEVDLIESEFHHNLHPAKFNLVDSDKDIRLIYLIKRYQSKQFYRKLTNIKDQEAKFETTCSEFLVYLKQYSSEKGIIMNNFQDVSKLFQEYSQIDDAQNQLHLFRTYLENIAEIQQLIRDLETHVLFPLSQLKLGFEKLDQRRVNITIQQRISDLKASLRDKTPFNLYSAQIDSFIPKTDRKIWGGLLYLIPAAVAILNDIDQQIDDYFQLGNLNEILTNWEHLMRSKKNSI